MLSILLSHPLCKVFSSHIIILFFFCPYVICGGIVSYLTVVTFSFHPQGVGAYGKVSVYSLLVFPTFTQCLYLESVGQPEVHLLVSQLSPKCVFCITAVWVFDLPHKINTLTYLMHVFSHLIDSFTYLFFYPRETSWCYPHVDWFTYSNVYLFSTCASGLLLTAVTSDTEMTDIY